MKIPKIAYIQTWGTYDDEMLVTVGMNFDEIVKEMKRLKITKEVSGDFIARKLEFLDMIESTSAHLWVFTNGQTLLYFPNWKHDWEHWDTLLHEICHAVHHTLGKHKRMMYEDEAKAYQIEFLFREIRRKFFELIK